MKHFQRYFEVILALVMLALTAFGLSACREKSISLKDDVTISCEGYSTIGRAGVTLLSEDEFISAYGESFKLNKALKDYFKNEGKADLEDFAPGLKAKDLSAEDLCRLFYRRAVKPAFEAGTLSKTDFIKNGEEISFSWQPDAPGFGGKSAQDYLCLFELPFVFENKTQKAEDLTTVPLFDPFDKIKISFESFAPFAQLVLDTHNTHIEGESYLPSAESAISNGDVITIRYELPLSPDECAAKYKKLPSRWEMEYTVAGVPEIVVTADQMNEAALERLDALGRSLFKRWSWESTGSTAELELIGYYLVSPTEEQPENFLLPVFKVLYTAGYSDNTGWHIDFEPGPLYWCCTLEGLAINGDGELSAFAESATKHTYKVLTDVVKQENKISGTKLYYTFSCYAYESVSELEASEVKPLVTEGFTLIEMVPEA